MKKENNQFKILSNYEQYEELLYKFSTPIKKMIIYFIDGTEKEMKNILLRKEDIKYMIAFNNRIAGILIFN